MRRVAFTLANATTAQLVGTDSLVHGPGCVTWHSTVETTGSATAEYYIFDGSTRNGVYLAYVTLSAGQSTRDYIGLHCLPFVESLHVNVVSGSISGAFIAWVDHTCEHELDLQHDLLRLQIGTDLSQLQR